MKNQLLHTPDGVRDIYNGECQKMRQLSSKLHAVLSLYGYSDIQTPTFEFFNIFSSEIGTTPSKDLYKFFDKEGNTLVLRPDFTPSIARSAAKYYMDQVTPVKLCYMGNTFVNSTNYQGRLKETTQCGAELIGDATREADAEILAMVVDSLLASGLQEFQISIGHSRYLEGLLLAAGIQDEEETNLRHLIQNKNFFGVEESISKLSIADNLKELFHALGSFDLSIAEISHLKEIAKPYPVIYSALEELIVLHGLLKLYDIERYTSYELGIISEHSYYTGIIFQGFTYGTGEPIVKGGRYDKLLGYFGKNAAAIGFAITVDQLYAALTRQKIDIVCAKPGELVIFDEACAAVAIAYAKQKRSEGTAIELVRIMDGMSKSDYESKAANDRIISYFVEE